MHTLARNILVISKPFLFYEKNNITLLMYDLFYNIKYNRTSSFNFNRIF